MIYVIMCGGKYPHFSEHKALTKINGEPLIQRTVRLLKSVTDEQIFITADDPKFSEYGIILPHENSYSHDGIKPTGYWLDAFYPYFLPGTEVTYLMGDVYYTRQAMNTIVNCRADQNTLFGTSDAMNENHQNIGEAFAYKITDYEKFLNGISEVKKMYDNGKLKRNPLIWELYRYLNGYDVNIQRINPDTYVCIDDKTMDIDYPEEINDFLF